MSKRSTFLQLSPEFGGVRFGPFEGAEIRLGSDESRNDITLPEALGVSGQHVRILIQSDGSYIVAPVERTASVFHWRAGSRRSKHITAPMAVAAGDSFSLVTPKGPLFTIQQVKGKKEVAEAAEESQGPKIPNLNMGRLSGSGLAAEIKRRGMARVLTSTLGHYVNNTWTFVKTGQLFSPRYVVTGLIIASGWIMAGGASCTALSFNSSKGKTVQQLTNCRDQLGMTADDDSGPTVPGLTRKILVDREWQTTIEADKDLYTAYADQLTIIFADAKRYRWAYSNKGGAFARFKGALEDKGLPPNLVRVLAYASAMPGFGKDRDWSVVYDSDGDEVCGRGPLALTYAQGYRLGLSSLQLDAMVERTVASGTDLGAKVTALEGTATRIDVPPSLDRDLGRSAGAELQGGLECLYINGPDDRDSVANVASQMRYHLGASVSRGLPREGEAHWIAARLAKLYAMDFRRGYDELDFDPKYAPSMAMQLGNVKASRSKYAIDQAAATIARAVAIPCLATLDKEVGDAPPSFMGDLPNLGNCAIVKAFVEYDRL